MTAMAFQGASHEKIALVRVALVQDEQCALMKRQPPSSSSGPRRRRNGGEGLDGTSHASSSKPTRNATSSKHRSDLDDTEHSIIVLALLNTTPDEVACLHASATFAPNRGDEGGCHEEYEDERRSHCRRQAQRQNSHASFVRSLRELSSGSLLESSSSSGSLNVSFSKPLEEVHIIPKYNDDSKAQCFYSGTELDDLRLDWEFEQEGLFPKASCSPSITSEKRRQRTGDTTLDES